MKKCMLFIGGLSLLLALTGCRSDGGTPAPSTAAEPRPTVSVTEVTTWTAAPTDMPPLEAPPTAVPPASEEAEEDREEKK